MRSIGGNRALGTLIPAPSSRGFSLVEVVLALGIISFVLVAIFGLFPVGYKNAQESRRETRAAYLAEQILNDLRSSPFTSASILHEDGNGVLEALPALDLSLSGKRALACDNQNAITRQIGEADYSNGVADPNAEFLAQVQVTPTEFDHLSEITVEVSAPVSAPLSARSRYSFHTLIKARQ